MFELVVIEKYSTSSFCWPNLAKQKKIDNLSVKQILNKYQGFEGEVIQRFSIRIDEKELEYTKNQCLKIINSNQVIMILINSEFEQLPSEILKKTFRVGYDVGYFVEEDSLYSSIFNEILFGHFDELIAFKNFLNDFLLFPGISEAHQYIEVHNQLSEKGFGVEDYMEMNIYEIRKFISY